MENRAVHAKADKTGEERDMKNDIWNRTEWFREARFGMFLHWGLYAIPARGEWIMSADRISPEEYEKNYFPYFEASQFDPDAWALAAKNAGMKYMILTAKHHDGFCLYDSALTDYKSTQTPCARDIVREFTDAARRHGLKVGLYYSLLDWHHEHFPYVGDPFHPLRDVKDREDRDRDFSLYLDYMHEQIRELCTQYGKIDIMWYDFSYANHSGEDWRATELIRMVRQYQPDVLIDNRLEASGDEWGSLVTDHPTEFAGDFVCPEQNMPVQAPTDVEGNILPWELCTTMNNSWGYAAADTLYKDPTFIIRNLVACVSKGGNLLVNVGPDARGSFPVQSLQILSAIGEWMQKNAESIYGCTAADLPKPDWGRYTRKGNVIYAHIFEPTMGPVPLTGIDGKTIKRVTFVRDGSELIDAGGAFGTRSQPGVKFVSLGSAINHTYPLQDPIDTVLKITLCACENG